MNNKKKDDDKNKQPKWLMIMLIALAATFALSFLSRSLLADRTGSLTYTEFLEILKTKEVKEVTGFGRLES